MSEPRRPPPPAAYVPSKVKPNGAPKSDGNLIDLDDGPPVPPRPPPDAIPVEAGTKQLKAKTRAPPPPPAPYSRTHQSQSPTGGGGPPPKPSRPRTAGDVPSHKPPPTSSLPPSRPRIPSSGSKQSQPEITVVSAEPMTSDVIPPPKKPDASKKDVKKAPPPKPSHPPPPIPPPISTKEQEESEPKPDAQKDDDLMKFSPATEKKSESSSPPAPKKEAPTKPQRKAPPPKPSHPAQPKPKGTETNITQPLQEESSISHSRGGSMKKAPPPISGRPKPPPPAPFAKRASIKAKDKTQDEETSSSVTSQSSGGTSPRAPPSHAPPMPTSNAPPVPTSNPQEERPTDDKEPIYAKVIKKPRPPSVVSETKPSETVNQGSSPPAPNKTPPTTGKQEEEKRKPPPSKPPPTKPPIPPGSVSERKPSPKPVRKAPQPPKSTEKDPQPTASPPTKPANEAPKPVPQPQPIKPQPQPTKPQPQPTKRGAAPGRPAGGPQRPSKPPPPSTGQPPPKPQPPRPSSMPRTDQPKRPTPAKRAAATQDEPPPLPPRPAPGHPLYKYVCPDPHGIATTNKESTFESELSYMQGDVIVLIEKVDEHWYWACNCDNDNEEGVVLGRNLKIVKRLPGSDTVAGFDDGPCAVAMNDYEGLRDDELTFKAGDLIMLKTHVGDDWFRGQLVNGTVGIFPKSFVEVVEELPPDAVESPPPPTPPLSPDITPSGPHCVAIETFSGETADDLSFTSGDIIELVERIDDNWLRGSLNGQTGMFPQSFVDIKVDIKVGVVSSAASSDSENVVTALYDYDVGEEGDLVFKANDRITVLSKMNDEWLYGKLNGKEGQFPATFVDRFPPNLPHKTPASADTSEQAKEIKTTATGECNALYDFETDAPGELAFVAGETIITTEKINDDWLYGKIGDREGIFPLSLVKIVKELHVAQPSANSSAKQESSKKKLGGEDINLLPKGVAISDFEPGSSAEIQLKTGDSVFLLTKEDQQWYMGENQRTGEIGNFPISFIDVITPLP